VKTRKMEYKINITLKIHFIAFHNLIKSVLKLIKKNYKILLEHHLCFI